MANKKITLLLDGGLKVTFNLKHKDAGNVIDQLFEEGKITKKAAREIALKSNDIDVVANLLAYKSDLLADSNIKYLYKKFYNVPSIMGEIAANERTPKNIIKELTDYPDENVAEMAQEILDSLQ